MSFLLVVSLSCGQATVVHMCPASRMCLVNPVVVGSLTRWAPSSGTWGRLSAVDLHFHCPTLGRKAFGSTLCHTLLSAPGLVLPWHLCGKCSWGDFSTCWGGQHPMSCPWDGIPEGHLSRRPWQVRWAGPAAGVGRWERWGTAAAAAVSQAAVGNGTGPAVLGSCGVSCGVLPGAPGVHSLPGVVAPTTSSPGLTTSSSLILPSWS